MLFRGQYVAVRHTRAKQRSRAKQRTHAKQRGAQSPAAMYAQIGGTLTLLAHVQAQGGRVVVDHGSALRLERLPEAMVRRKAIAGRLSNGKWCSKLQSSMFVVV
jgi:hypothetical protein